MIFLPLLLLALAGCSESGSQQEYEFPDPEKEVLIELPASWELQDELMQDFPEGIEVYRNTTSFIGKALDAYCVVFDPKDAELELEPALANSSTRPSQWYAAEEGTKYAAINGGFFGPNVSYSLVMDDGEVAAHNIAVLNRPFNEVNTPYYPTRGAFGITATGTPVVSWVYSVGSDIFSYPEASPNELGLAPQPQPSASFPQGGSVWNAMDAIGGSPVLIKNGSINITDDEELIAVDNNISRARSAIGHTSDGKVILLAVEGNNTNGGAGLSLEELAKLMLEMGCTAALNLDGGGSTYMIVDGEETVKASSASGERAVMSMVFLKKR